MGDSMEISTGVKDMAMVKPLDSTNPNVDLG